MILPDVPTNTPTDTPPPEAPVPPPPSPEQKPSQEEIQAAVEEEQNLLRDHMQKQQTQYLLNRCIELNVQARLKEQEQA